MKLYLIRHGEALPRAPDSERPLSERGRADVERLAAVLALRGVTAAHVFHSGIARAEQTAVLVAEAVIDDGRCEAQAGLSPNDPVEAVAMESERWSDDMVLVGHLPFMDRLAARLVVGREDVTLVAFDTGSCLCLERQDDGGWSVVWMLSPELLAD
jgi:phosphohistidine phosphatase